MLFYSFSLTSTVIPCLSDKSTARWLFSPHFYFSTIKPTLHELITIGDNNRKQNTLMETSGLSFKRQPALRNAIKHTLFMGKLRHHLCASNLCSPQLHRVVLMILPRGLWGTLRKGPPEPVFCIQTRGMEQASLPCTLFAIDKLTNY